MSAIRSDADALAAMTLAEPRAASPTAGPAADDTDDDGDAMPLSVLFARGQAAHRSLDGTPPQVCGSTPGGQRRR
jgi:hypothetical protein